MAKVALLFATIVIYGNPIQSAAVKKGGIKGAIGQGRLLAPIATSEVPVGGAPTTTAPNNVYIGWNNNDTGHWYVFFLKSSDSGKTFAKNIKLSAPTWWTNKTGVLMPVFRGSNDNGNTFGNTIMLYSTAG